MARIQKDANVLLITTTKTEIIVPGADGEPADVDGVVINYGVEEMTFSEAMEKMTINAGEIAPLDMRVALPVDITFERKVTLTPVIK